MALAVAAFLARKWISHQLARNLEHYKSQLVQEIETHKSELSQRSEVLKTELSIYAHEQNVGLTRIDAQRSDAILEIWSVLSEWHEAYLDLTAPNRDLIEQPERAIEQYRNWAQRLTDKSDQLSMKDRNLAIFFDQSTYETISRCGNEISDLTTQFYESLYGPYGSPDKKDFIRRLPSACDTLRTQAKGSIDELRGALVHEFRVLMRAEKPTAKKELEGST